MSSDRLNQRALGSIFRFEKGGLSGRRGDVHMMNQQVRIKAALTEAIFGAISELGAGALKATSMSPLSHRVVSEETRAAA